eukprot:TRINITY_DN6710_c0_g1_i2.p1 TRINITY_DN6710_c0_g1~~TRINITY_DN6710_c0_g1_i2.p1  ORF type:complete len:112 (+),score=27.63 TRINITY_DN6710_c0_g1_i2:102-437(+)
MTVKCDKSSLEVIIDENIEETAIDEVAWDLPEAPRYIIYSYKWERDDGRVQYPLIFIYYSPPSSAMLNMMYASTKVLLQQTFENLKYMEATTADEIDEAWLKEKLLGSHTR